MYSVLYNCIYKTELRHKQNDHIIIIMIGVLDSMISRGQSLQFCDCDNKIEKAILKLLWKNIRKSQKEKCYNTKKCTIQME